MSGHRRIATDAFKRASTTIMQESAVAFALRADAEHNESRGEHSSDVSLAFMIMTVQTIRDICEAKLCEFEEAVKLSGGES